MKKLIASSLTIIAIAAGCTNSNEVTDKKQYSDAEIQKLEEMKALYESYGWEVDSTVPEEKRNEMLLNTNRDTLEAFLQMFVNPNDKNKD